MKYFSNIATLDDLKKEFRRLAMLHHPDRGGDTATMQAINAEYEMLFPALKLAYNKTAEQPTTETAESYRSEFYTANGWKGERYDSSRSLKEIAQLVRAYIKEFYPTYKFSVRTKYASMCQELHVEMLEAPTRIYKTFEELTEDDTNELWRKMVRNNVFTLKSWNREELRAEFERIWSAPGGDFYKCVNEQIRETAKAVDAYVNSYNYDDCDGMIDYFDVNFYYFGCLQNNGRGVKFVPRTARIKAAEAPEKATPETEQAPAVRVEINPEHDGVEVYFTEKPTVRIREALKSDGWRWHGKKGCWYNKNSENHLQQLRGSLETPELAAGAAM